MYIFNGGEKDDVFPPIHGKSQEEYYEYFGSKVKYVQQEVGHKETSIWDEFSGEDLVFNGYDQANDLLGYLYQNLKTNPASSWNAPTADWKGGVFKRFFQTEFLDTTIF